MPPADPASQYPVVGGSSGAFNAGDGPPWSGDAIGGSVLADEGSGQPGVAGAVSLVGATAAGTLAQVGTADVGPAGHRVLVGTGVAAAAGTAVAADPTSTAPAETAARRTHRRSCRLRDPLAIPSPSSCVVLGYLSTTWFLVGSLGVRPASIGDVAGRGGRGSIVWSTPRAARAVDPPWSRRGWPKP